MTRWYCSDHHIGHSNIIRFSNRPFANVREMDEKLLEFHNMFVRPEDHVSFLGDVTLRRGGRVDREWFVKEMKRYNGHKRLFLGNHDHLPIRTYLDAGFEKVYATWRSQESILWSHIPVHPKSMSSAIANVHGHTHTQPDYEPVLYVDPVTQKIKCKPYINICVEQTDYHPISLEEIQDRIRKVRESVGDM